LSGGGKIGFAFGVGGAIQCRTQLIGAV
jgi:hypothetical protein